jgi:ABC-type nitrate/sulfonate/bicarbonate transport system permease component
MVVATGPRPTSTALDPVDEPPAGAPRPGRLPGWLRRAALPALGVVVFVAAWEWFGRSGTFGKTFVPLSDLPAEWALPGRSALIRRAASVTFGRAATGLVVGFLAAVVVAGFASLVPRVRATVNASAVALNSVPWVALGPLLMIVVSRDRAPAVIAGLAAFFPSFVCASTGFSSLSRDQEDLAAALGVSSWRRFRHVRLPNALPSLVLGLKLAVPSAMIGAIFGEWFGTGNGLGMLLLTSMQNFRPALLWTVGLLAAAVTLVAYGLLSLLEAWITRRFSLPAPEVSAIPKAGGRWWVRLLGWLALFVVLIVAWQLYVEASGVSPLLVSTPARVWDDLSSSPGLYVENALSTLRLGATGLVLGMLAGTALAIACWWFAFLRGLLTPVVLVARAVPTLALLPVVAGVLGYNDRSIIAISVLISFFPAFVFAAKGLKTLPDGSADLLAALGTPRRRIFWLLALPASLRDIAVALRMSAGICIISAVAAEFLIGERGLGRFFADAMGRQNIDRAWAVALVIVALSVAAFALVNAFERALNRRLS